MHQTQAIFHIESLPYSGQPRTDKCRLISTDVFNKDFLSDLYKTWHTPSPGYSRTNPVKFQILILHTLGAQLIANELQVKLLYIFYFICLTFYQIKINLPMCSKANN